jgi:hypothetical protein
MPACYPARKVSLGILMNAEWVRRVLTGMCTAPPYLAYLNVQVRGAEGRLKHLNHFIPVCSLRLPPNLVIRQQHIYLPGALSVYTVR